MSEKPEIDVERRCKSEKPQRRDTAPVRRQSGQPSASASSSGGSNSSSGGGGSQRTEINQDVAPSTSARRNTECTNINLFILPLVT